MGLQVKALMEVVAGRKRDAVIVGGRVSVKRRQRVQVFLEESLPGNAVGLGDNQHSTNSCFQTFRHDRKLRKVHFFFYPFFKLK